MLSTESENIYVETYLGVIRRDPDDDILKLFGYKLLNPEEDYHKAIVFPDPDEDWTKDLVSSNKLKIIEGKTVYIVYYKDLSAIDPNRPIYIDCIILQGRKQISVNLTSKD